MLRDVEHHALTQEISQLRVAPVMHAIGEALGAGLSSKQQAMLHLMMSFFTWRTLAGDCSLDQGAAVELAVNAILRTG